MLTSPYRSMQADVASPCCSMQVDIACESINSHESLASKIKKKLIHKHTESLHSLLQPLNIFSPCNQTRNSIRNRVGQHNLKGLPPAANFSIRGSTISHIRLILQKISRVLPQQSPKPINQLWKDLESNEVFRKPHQFYRQIEDKT
jgi:hypothetical protein